MRCKKCGEREGYFPEESFCDKCKGVEETMTGLMLGADRVAYALLSERPKQCEDCIVGYFIDKDFSKDLVDESEGDYYVVNNDTYTYTKFNYCPICGRALLERAEGSGRKL